MQESIDVMCMDVYIVVTNRDVCHFSSEQFVDVIAGHCAPDRQQSTQVWSAEGRGMMRRVHTWHQSIYVIEVRRKVREAHGELLPDHDVVRTLDEDTLTKCTENQGSQTNNTFSKLYEAHGKLLPDHGVVWTFLDHLPSEHTRNQHLNVQQ